MRADRDILRKRRTRAHIIADLSVNWVERIALLCGFAVQATRPDYGIDLNLYTFDEDGEPDPGYVLMQLKATDNLVTLADGETIPVRIDRADLARWLDEPMPVILILYAAREESAYWLYVQAHFARLRREGFALSSAGATLTVHLSRAQILDQTAMRRFAQYKARMIDQVEGVQHDDG
jgi:hypothetical protein